MLTDPDDIIPCPTCGKPPASLIEDGYGIDLVPWWRYFLQRINPWRMVFPAPRPEMQWIPIGECDNQMRMHDRVALLVGKNVSFRYAVIVTSQFPAHRDALDRATHWCPLPPFP